jgi:hypothetical protein
VWKALKVPNWKSVSEGPVGEEGRAVYYWPSVDCVT